MQPHTFLIQIMFHPYWVFFLTTRSPIAYSARILVAMNLNQLLNPNTPPHRLLKSTCVSKSASLHSQSKHVAPQRTESPPVGHVASRVTQERPPLESAVRPVAWPTENRHEVAGEPYAQPSQKTTAHYGSCRTSSPEKLLHTLNFSTADAARLEQTPIRDVNTPPVAAPSVTSTSTIKKTVKAVKQAPKRRKKEEKPASVTAEPSYESTTLRTPLPLLLPKDANVPKADLATPLKRVSCSAAPGLDLDAGPRKLIQEVLQNPLNLPVPDANEAKSKKRKRATPKLDKALDPASICHRVRRKCYGKTEDVTLGGWVAFRRVEVEAKGKVAGANGSRGDADSLHLAV